MTVQDGMLAGRGPDDLDRTERRELISAYLDGELPAHEARQITLWLDENPGALKEVEHIRRTFDLLDHYADEPVPAGFAARVSAAVGIVHPTRAGRVFELAWYRRPQVLLAAAAVVLAAVGVLFSMREGATPSTPAGPAGSTSASVAAAVLDEVPDELLLQLDKLTDLDDEVVDTVIDDYDDLLAQLGG